MLNNTENANADKICPTCGACIKANGTANASTSPMSLERLGERVCKFAKERDKECINTYVSTGESAEGWLGTFGLGK